MATPNNGILGPEWFKWRGATLRVTLREGELEVEQPFIARLGQVIQPGAPAARATLTELDASGKPLGVRGLPWPPEGEVRVVRAP